MSNFWNIWIWVLSLGNVFACVWLIRWTMKPTKGESAEGEVTGHTWDGLQEYNNPLPRWWLWLFYITIVFGLVYYALYPGLGTFKGVLGWTSDNQWQGEMTAADENYGPIFKKFASQEIPALAKDEEAKEIGHRLFSNYCAQCHGSDAKGNKGFPNLTDNDWLWGGEPEQIKTSIATGRNGVMPGHEPIIGADGVKQVTQYVVSLSGRKHDAALAAEGKKHFDTVCMACHLPSGEGNQALGAANLTDKVWLHGSTIASIESIIGGGKMGQMPAHKDFLGDDKVHLLSAYVYGLSQ